MSRAEAAARLLQVVFRHFVKKIMWITNGMCSFDTIVITHCYSVLTE